MLLHPPPLLPSCLTSTQRSATTIYTTTTAVLKPAKYTGNILQSTSICSGLQNTYRTHHKFFRQADAKRYLPGTPVLPPSSMGEDLQFVNFSSDPSRNSTARKFVRTHVMKKYRKQKRVEREARGQVEKNSRYCVPYHRTSHFSLAAATKKDAMESKRSEEASEQPVESEYNSRLPWSPVSVEQSSSSNDENNTSLWSEVFSCGEVQLRLVTMDARLNAYNFLPIDASPRVIKLLYQSRHDFLSFPSQVQ
jgi:hypothetical protein